MSTTSRDDKVVDSEGVRLRVGMQVKFGEEKGEVTAITEFEVDEYRPIYPKVTVKFGQGDYEDFFTGPLNLRYPGDYDGWECNELVACDCPVCGGSGVRCCEFGAAE